MTTPLPAMEDSTQAQLRALTFPRYRNLLTEPREHTVPIATEEKGDISGLALLFFPAAESAAEPAAQLLSIMVTPGRRRSGIARELIRRADQAARERGRDTISTWFSTRLPMRAAFESLLAGAGWDPAFVETMRTAGYAAAVVAELDRIGPRSSVTEDERPEIERLAAAIEFSRDLHPARWERSCQRRSASCSGSKAASAAGSSGK